MTNILVMLPALILDMMNAPSSSLAKSIEEKTEWNRDIEGPGHLASGHLPSGITPWIS